MTRRAALLPLLLLSVGSLSLASCGGKQETPAPASQAQEAPAAGTEAMADPQASDSGVGPISSRGTTPEGGAAPAPAPPGPEGAGPATPANDAKLRFDLPKG